MSKIIKISIKSKEELLFEIGKCLELQKIQFPKILNNLNKKIFEKPINKKKIKRK